jgi:hypothetical protein
MKPVYITLAIVGFLLPLSQLPGLHPTTFFPQAFANPVASMFTFDLLISSVAFWVLLFTQQRVRHRWLYVVLNLLVGLSFALPMFLLARERAS